MKKKVDLLIYLLILIILIVLTSYFFIVRSVLSFEEAGQFGDLFGAMNALFTALAFWGVLFTIRKDHQKYEKDQKNLKNEKNITDFEKYTLILKAIKYETENICTVLQCLLEDWEKNIYEFKKCIEQKAKGAIIPDFPKLRLNNFNFNDTFMSSMKIEICKHNANDNIVSNVFKLIFVANDFSQSYSLCQSIFISKLQKNDFSYNEDLVSATKQFESFSYILDKCKELIDILKDEIKDTEEIIQSINNEIDNGHK